MHQAVHSIRGRGNAEERKNSGGLVFDERLAVMPLREADNGFHPVPDQHVVVMRNARGIQRLDRRLEHRRTLLLIKIVQSVDFEES